MKVEDKINVRSQFDGKSGLLMAKQTAISSGNSLLMGHHLFLVVGTAFWWWEQLFGSGKAD